MAAKASVVGPGIGLDVGRDFGAVVEAVAGGGHLGEDDELGAGDGRTLGEFEEGAEVALAVAEGGFELNGGSEKWRGDWHGAVL